MSLPEKSSEEKIHLLYQQFDRRRRLFYLMASLASFPSILAVWLQHRQENPFIAWAYPLLMVSLLMWSFALLWPRIPLMIIERSVLVGVSLLFLSKFMFLLLFSKDLQQQWAEIEAIFWVFVFLFIISFMTFRRDLALGYCLTIIALSLGVGMWYFWGFSHPLWVEFVRLEVRIAGIALLIFLLARAKDELNQTMAEVNRIQHIAYTDVLTQLPNRRAITALLEEHLLCKRKLAVILADVDHFKRINDTFGHETGDRVLREVGECLHTQLRASDVIGRWGGEEFIILVLEDQPQRVHQLTTRLRDVIETHPFTDNIPITLSFGVTLMSDHDTLKTLVNRADVALYRAKNNGRNRVEWAEPG